MKKFRTKKAQQLVEFLLVAPFLIIILGILTEYAYALNINMTLSKGLKAVSSTIYSEIRPSMTKSDIETLISGYLLDYLDENSVPTLSENNVHVTYEKTDKAAIFMASYTYLPAFTLPNMWFKFVPDQFDFFSTAAVPVALVGANNYDATINSEKLDKIWSASASFASQDAFKDSKKGILKNDTGRNNLLFLAKTSAATNLSDPYSLVSWDGALKKDSFSGDVFTVDMADGKFYTCSLSTSVCALYSDSFVNYVTGNSLFNLFFVPATYAPTDLTNLPAVWVVPSGSMDLSDSAVSGNLKNLLSMSESGKSLGNYEGLSVSAYNPGITSTQSYNMKSYGSFVVIYTEQNPDKLALPTLSNSYDFGGKVN